MSGQQQQMPNQAQQQQRFPSQWSQVPPQVQGMHQQSMQPQQQQQRMRMNSPRYSAMTPQMTMNQGITQTTSNQLPSDDIMTFMSDGFANSHPNNNNQSGLSNQQQNPQQQAMNPSDQLTNLVENL
jgi:hypothetical protein